MICPKCGFEQPESPECMRCGIFVSRYKGPVLGGAPVHAASPSLPPPLSPPPALPLSESAGTVFGGPPPAPAATMAVAGGGTLYEGPLPAAGGGTVYGGEVYGGTVYGGPGSAPVARSSVKRPFEIGKVLSETFSVYFSNFIPFALLTGIALAPLYMLQAYITSLDFNAASPAAFLPLIVLFVSAILCPYLATGAITYGVFQQMRGGDASIGDCLGRGMSSLGPVLGLAIWQGLCVLFGLVLCLIPGILWALKWAVSVPAMVEEKPGITGAMDRSAFLTEGYRGDVFGVLFVLNILDSGTTLVLTMFAAKNQDLALVLTGVKSLLTVGLSATATAVMYYRLRSIKESIDVDQISSVFA